MCSTNGLVSERAQQGILTTPPDEKSRCMITPRDGADNSTIQDIEYDLKTITEAKKIYSFTDQSRGKFMWWIVSATPNQLEKIRRHKKIKFAARSGKAAESCVVNHSFGKTPPSLDDDDDEDEEPGHSTLTKKEDTQIYKAQSNAARELRQLSIPKDAIDRDQWPDHVYQQAAGEGIYILHIEMGVSNHQRAQKELPSARVLPAIQTKYSKELGDSPSGAEGKSHHSTCVASKAIGTQYGSSKKAILWPVKIGEIDNSCIAEGLDAAVKMVRDRGLQRKAVVLVSLDSNYEVEAEEDDDPIVESQRDSVGMLADQGIAVIASSGNWAQTSSDFNVGRKRTGIDTMPSVSASVHPMIPVGNVNWNGELQAHSQGGELAVTHAMGTDVTCIDRRGRSVTNTGTSFAAPLVAGEVANLLSTNDASLPFNRPGLSDREFATELRNYLKEEASRTSPSGINVLHNGVTKEAYEKAQKEAEEDEC